ncbi:hypothetical protein ACJX0J_028683, partial [Zea mays]
IKPCTHVYEWQQKHKMHQLRSLSLILIVVGLTRGSFSRNHQKIFDAGFYTWEDAVAQLLPVLGSHLYQMGFTNVIYVWCLLYLFLLFYCALYMYRHSYSGVLLIQVSDFYEVPIQTIWFYIRIFYVIVLLNSNR